MSAQHPAAPTARWPDVPDCHGWLALDRRGQWRLQGKPVTHRGLIDFIGKNYQQHANGAWLMQNGPQRVWVDLAATPWIFRLQGSGDALLTHTGIDVGQISRAWLVDDEQLCLAAACGFGLVDDRDLAQLAARIRRRDGAPPDAADYATGQPLCLSIGGSTLPLERCTFGEIERLGAFRRQAPPPQPQPAQSLSA